MNRKHITLAAIFTLSIWLSGALSGCEMSPEQTERLTLNTATEVYKSTMQSLVTFRDAGMLTDEQVEQINEVEPLIWVALNQWHTAVGTGEDPADPIDTFERGLRTLRDILIEITNRGPPE